ncbi:hypothetical protein M2640_27140, partial [Klebsiella pneumoniae]|nr:hypothetical protein [Klebsiella pneumoniae]
MPAFEWVHVQLHQQKGMISLSPPTICNSALFHWCPEPFNPQRAVGVEHDFDHCRVFQQLAYLRPEFAPQFFRYALIVFCTI